MTEADVVPLRVAVVAVQPDDTDVLEALFDVGGGAVAGAVVNVQKLIGVARHVLVLERAEAGVEVVAPVVSEHDDARRRRLGRWARFVVCF